jgi:sugar phosphate isomerase/epimerase
LQVGISTASFFNKCNVEDTPARMKAIGTSLCEIFLNTFSEYEEDFVSMLAGNVRDNELQVYSIHPMGTQFEPQLFSPHARQKADALKIYRQVLRAGSMLGARCYVMHGPAGLNGAVKNMELPRIGPIVQELCEIAGEYGLTLAWENVSWCLFSIPSFGARLLEATGADDLRFTLDIKQAVRSGYSPLEYVEAIGERLINLHICDYRYVAGRFRLAMPGQGDCGFFALRAALEQKKYKGPAFIEVYSDMFHEDTEILKSYQYIQRCMGDAARA